MKKVVISIIIIIAFLAIGITYWNTDKSKAQTPKEKEIEIEVEGKNKLVKTFNKTSLEFDYEAPYMYPFLAVVSGGKERTLTINIKNGVAPKNYTMINSQTGEFLDFTKISDTKLEITLPVNETDNYGILFNNELVGGVKGVDSLENIDMDTLESEALSMYECGF